MRNSLRFAFLAGLCLVLLHLPARVEAQDGVRKAALILRILSYDRNLTSRAGGNVRILVVHQRGNSASEAEASQLVSALNALGRRTTVANMHPQAVQHAYQNRSGLESAARSRHAVAVYFCQGLDPSLRDLTAAARATHMLSMSGDRSSVRSGLSVALISDGSRVRLVINLPAVEAEGARLDATVLRLAEVIR